MVPISLFNVGGAPQRIAVPVTAATERELQKWLEHNTVYVQVKSSWFSTVQLCANQFGRHRATPVRLSMPFRLLLPRQFSFVSLLGSHLQQRPQPQLKSKFHYAS